MSSPELFPDYPNNPLATYNAIQTAINTNATVRFHPGTYDIGAYTLKVRKAITIEGLLSGEDQNTRPIIKGSSGALYTDKTANPNSPGDVYKSECGIFNILASGCDVTIKNLILKHYPGPNPNKSKRIPEDQRRHGSSTIAYFVDNQPTARLTVMKCDIDTRASSGISINAVGQPQTTAKGQITNIVIDGCHIVGRRANYEGEAQGGGNFIAVKLGDVMGSDDFPVDLRNSRFEVKECYLDAAKWAGVVATRFQSDANSEFNIEGNHIGFNPAPIRTPDWPSQEKKEKFAQLELLDAIRVGVYFRTPACGKITASGNCIKLWDYFSVPALGYPDHSVALWISVQNGDAAQSVSTEIKNNEIHFEHTLPPHWTTPPGAELDLPKQTLDGILFDDAQPGGSVNCNTIICCNTVTSASVSPLRGIYVRTMPAATSQPNQTYDLQVYGNDMTGLIASHAQVFVDKGSRNCKISGNLYGGLASLKGGHYAIEPAALLLCDGTDNEFDENLSGCDVPGWEKTTAYSASLHTGPGRVELDRNSNNNVVHVDYETAYWPSDSSEMQVWNRGGAGNQIEGVVWVVPSKPPRPRIGRPIKHMVDEISPLERIPEGVRFAIWSEQGEHQPTVIFASPAPNAFFKASVGG